MGTLLWIIRSEVAIDAFNLRKRRKDLLEHAKREVEIAIEQDKQAAIDWLESVLEIADT